MKAVFVETFKPTMNVGIGEVPDPRPGDSEVVIDVAAADVNYPDLLIIEGRYQFKPPLLFTPGKAAAGVVSAADIGSGRILSVLDQLFVTTGDPRDRASLALWRKAGEL